MNHAKPLVAFLLLLLLAFSGCLGNDDADAGSQDDPSETPPGGTGSPGAPASPSAPTDRPSSTPAEPGLLDWVDMEALGCAGASFELTGPGDAVQARMPEGYSDQGRDTDATMQAHVHQCKTVVLDDRVLGEDVWFGFLYVFIEGDNETLEPGRTVFFLETYTDWPVLHDLWSGRGMDVHQATFTLTASDSEPHLEIRAPGLSYTLDATDWPFTDADVSLLDLLALAGEDGGTWFELDLVSRKADNAPRGSVGTFEGGLLGEVFPAPAPALFSIDRFSLNIQELR